MKIGASSPIDLQALADHAPRTGTAASASSANGVAATTTDRVDVSAAGAQLNAAGSGDFDQAKVDEIRQAIRENRFQINARAIADRLIADAAALLGPRP